MSRGVYPSFVEVDGLVLNKMNENPKTTKSKYPN